MINYDKNAIRESLEVENYFQLLEEFGGEPEYTSFGIISSTICHNEPGEGSRKLYWYKNSNLFHCYTGCEEPSFDIFQLVIKVYDIQFHQNIDLNSAVRWVAQHFGIAGAIFDNNEINSDDWTILKNYDKIQDINIEKRSIVLKEYDPVILKRFNYNTLITPWEQEYIDNTVMKYTGIGYYPGDEKIVIPHFDINNRLIGIRGRALVKSEAELYGKYRPLYINKILYSHPLGMNLYGLNWAKNNIQKMRKAIIVESEKSVLKHETYFPQANMSVACCGSNLTIQQVQLLLDLGVQEIILAFDRQFQKLGDEEYIKLKNKVNAIRNKYKNYVNVSIIWDKKMITGYKDSPIDCGPEKFLQLFKERLVL